MSSIGRGSLNSATGLHYLSTDGDGGSHALSDSRRSSITYDTKYQRSLRHYLTREALPSEPNYRNLNSIVGLGGRPTLEELHDANYQDKQIGEEITENEHEEKLRGKVVKFGWKEGVLMRCMLNIWGVMLFLRLSWVVGEAGVVFGILLIVLANSITTITAISMSAVATNGRIKAGGIYYMISRSLGPEFGGSIGLLFTLANSIASSTYIIGFVNAVQDMCAQYFDDTEIIPGLNGGRNDVRVLGTITLILVLLLAIVGMDWVTKVQMGLLFLLVASQVDFLIGAFMGPTSDEERAKGYVGFNGDILSENVKRDFRYYEGEQGFFSVFGVFFTAVTGIVAGANLSGDLKDPADSIPKGTLLAIAITGSTYIIYPIIIGASVVRDAVGNTTFFGESYENVYDNPTYNASYCGPFSSEGQSACKYGLQNSFQIMELMSGWGPLIYIGTFAATLSSAIASLVGAPRVLQALAKDKLYPYVHFFAKGHGANNDPVRGYILVFIVSFACIMIGELNAVSTLLTNCFLASYSLINFSCFHASLIKSPGWRPSFKYYSSYVSFLGGVICVIVMFLIDWITALITIVAAILLYAFVAYRKPEVNWGSSIEGQNYLFALKTTMDLINTPENIKNYRPQILLLTGNPSSRPPLVHFAQSITYNSSLLVCGNVERGPLTQRLRNSMTIQTNKWLTKQKVRSFYTMVEAADLEEGAKFMFQVVGLGKLRPNMVLLGFKSNWRECDRTELKSYFNTLHEALDMHMGIAILRVPEGLDYSQILEDESSLSTEAEKSPKMPVKMISVPSSEIITDALVLSENAKNLRDGETKIVANVTVENEKAVKNKERFFNIKTVAKRDSIDNMYKGIGGTELPKDVLNNLTRFKRKQKKGTIDVWWLYDDGGLTLLLPYILRTRSQWSDCKLRVFALANRKAELDLEQRSMANLLSKFRIDVSDMVIIPDLAKKAEKSSQDEFKKLISSFRLKYRDSENGNEDLLISDEELKAHSEKTNRHLRLREVLLQNSKDSTLVVMSLPMPRKNSVSAPLYMAWVETLTRGMPPFLLVRGNQTSVLTFYS